jgi:conjugative relaxase-like TrwC/TraI family protein
VGVGNVTASGDVDYLTQEVARGREGYYVDAVVAGEPPGRWAGKGAAALGLAGEVDSEEITALYHHLRTPDGTVLGIRPVHVTADERYAAALTKEPDASPERRAELRAKAEDAAKSIVAYYDWTYSLPKSLSTFQAALEAEVLEARARGDHQAAARAAGDVHLIDEAMLAACEDAVTYAEQAAAYGRTGHHGGGQGRYIDTKGLAVAQYPQHTSRAGDPQTHAHNAILNNVECADGKRRALDGAGLYRESSAMAAIASRSLEARLVERWPGMRFVDRADGHGRELDPALVPPELTYAFSRRRDAIVPRTEALAEEFRATRGREPTRGELAKLADRASMQTRAAKNHDGMTKAEQVTEWTATAREVVPGGFRTVVDRVETAAAVAPDTFSDVDVIERALSIVGDADPASRGQGRQTWTRAQLIRAVDRALPPNLGTGPERAVALLERLADKALASDGAVQVTAEPVASELLPDSARLADGRSALSRPGATVYATAGQLVADRAMRDAAVLRGASTVDAAHVQAALDACAANEFPLGADQAAALTGVLTSGAQLEVISAPAGTGKTHVVGVIAAAWQDAPGAEGGPGRSVFGLAQSQIAATGLAAEGLPVTRNLAAWSAAMGRLDAGRGLPGDEELRLTAESLVFVDEAGMAGTAELLAVQQRCAAVGAKLVLVGDERQLAAIGAGGTFSDVAEHGVTYRLVEVRRFDHGWEGPASLRLRAGDPSVIAEYDRHGRVRDGGTVDQARAVAAREHLAAILDGRDALLVVQTNEQAAAASTAIREELVRLGRVDAIGVPLEAGTVAGVGDLVQYRHIDRSLLGYAGNVTSPENRGMARVAAVRDDGGLVTLPITGRDEHGAETLGTSMQLPPEYVAEHVALGYASTIHAAQGRTVDVCYTVAGAGTARDSLYVSMSRGRDSNVVFVVTRATGRDAAAGEAHSVEPRPPAAVLRDILRQGEDRNTAALQQQERSLADECSAPFLVASLAQVAGVATATRTSDVLDQLTADGRLSPEQLAAIVADDAYPSLDRLARAAEAAGHDRAVVLAAAVDRGSFDGSRSVAKVLHARVREELRGQLTPQLETFHDLVPTGHDPEYTPYLTAIADRLDEVRADLGAQVADRGDEWAVRDLGAVPDDPIARLEWEDRAGWAEVARALGGVDSDADPLGAAPPAGAVEHHAVFRTAHHVLNRPEAGADEAEASDGQLRVRARAGERVRDWLPAHVDDELAATSQAADRRAADAALWSARAAVEEDPDTRARLAADAEEARADAERLAGLRDELEEVAAGRDEALSYTAVTRDRAERAKIELAIRGIDRDDPADLVTAEEWLTAREEAERSEDPHREVTDELDLTDQAAARAAAHEAAVREAGARADATSTVVDDAPRLDEAPQLDDEVQLGQAAPDQVGSEPTLDDDQGDAATPAESSGEVDAAGTWARDEDAAATPGVSTPGVSTGRSGGAAHDDPAAVPTLADEDAGQDLSSGGGDPADGGPAPRVRRPGREDALDAAEEEGTERAMPDPARGDVEDQDDADRAAPDRGNDSVVEQEQVEEHEAPERDGSSDRRRVPPADKTREQVGQARDALREVADQRAQDAALEAADAAAAAEASQVAATAGRGEVDADDGLGLDG